MKRGRLPAFTILELVLAMLITGLLIGMAFSVVTMIIGIHRDFNEKNEAMAKVLLLDRLLKKDFRQAKVIQMKGEQILFVRAADTVIYQMTAVEVLRKQQALTDTLAIKVNDLRLYFDKHEVINYSDGTEEKMIDGLGFRLLLKTKELQFNYQKMYSAQDLFNTTHAINRP
jgi:type II secretory pathway pseudopilin PulG